MGFFTIILMNIIQSPVTVLIFVCVSTQTGIFESKIQQKDTDQKQCSTHIQSDAQHRERPRRLTRQDKFLNQAHRTFFIENVHVCHMAGSLQGGSIKRIRNMRKRGIRVNISTKNSQYKHR